MWKKKDGKKKEGIAGRTIRFKMNDGTLRWLYGGGIKTVRDSIEAAKRYFRGQYIGTYDLYRFKLENNEIIEIISKFSYEEIYKIWMNRDSKIDSGYVAWGYKFKEDDEEWNKEVMIIAMLFTMRLDGLGEVIHSTGDPELDKNLVHDLILSDLTRLDAFIQKNPKKKIEALSHIKQQIELYSHYYNIEVDTFNRIIDSMEKNDYG